MEFSQERFEAAYQIVQLCADACVADQLSTVLSPAVLSLPTLHIFSRLASTNQTLWELLAQGVPIGSAAIALQQTAGRGQWGRQWQSSLGGLYLSVALAPELAVENSAQLTICTAWGIATALRTVPGKLSGVNTTIPVQVKWLNDLVLNGRKLGGILTETRVQQGKIRRAVVGVGVNWTNPVPETGINLQSYLEQQHTPLIESLEMLAAITLYGLLVGYHYWQAAGITAVLPAYLELLTHRDRPLTIDSQTGTITGVTATGELQVCLCHSDGSVSHEILLKPGTISLGYESTSTG